MILDIILSLVLFIVTVFLVIDSFVKRKKCTKIVEGKVCDIEWDDEVTVPVFEYTVNGNTYRVKSKTSMNFFKYRIGTNIEIHFNPEKPEQCYVKESNISIIVWGIICSILEVLYMLMLIYYKL